MSKKKRAKVEEAERPLPETIYGGWSDDVPEEQYVRTDPDAASLIETGETITVGVYKLVGKAQVKNATTVTPAEQIRPPRPGRRQ